MAATYEPIATTTLSSAASSITFSSIPGTYTDLRLVLVLKFTASAAVYLRFNNNTTNTYSWTELQGDGTSATSSRGSDTAGFALGNVAFDPSQWGMATVDIFSYTGSTNKTSLTQRADDTNGAGNVMSSVSLWKNTSAITRIDLINQASTTFQTGTIATLYGILKA